MTGSGSGAAAGTGTRAGAWAWAMLALLLLAGGAWAQGLDFVLVCDESGSMEHTSLGKDGQRLAASDPQRLRVDSSKLFVELCGPADRVAVVGFGSRVSIHAPLTATDDEGKETLEAAIDRIQGSQGNTDMYGALRQALSLLDEQGQEGRRAFLVFLTDGRIDGPGDLPKTYTDRYTLEEYTGMLERAAAEAGQKSTPLLTIALGPGADQELLARLASLGKGRAYQAQDASQLEPIYTDIFCNLTGRFFRHATGSEPPLDVQVEPGLKEFVTLGFPPRPLARRGHGTARYDAGFKFNPPEGGTGSGTAAHASTRAWDLARLKDPSPGRWRVDFQKDRVADLLLVKTPHCRFAVTRPDQASYPPGTVDLEVTESGDDGHPAPGCLAQAHVTVTGPGLPSPADLDLAESAPGRLTGHTPELKIAGDYRAVFRCYLPGGKDFASEQQRTFKIDTSLQQAKKSLQVKIARPEAPSYPAGSAVPVEAQVVSPGAGLSPGEANTDLSVTGKDGPVTIDAPVEHPAGVFASKTGPLAPGDYTVKVRAHLAADPSVTAEDSRTFTIVQPPPTPITLTIDAPGTGTRPAGPLAVHATVKGPDGVVAPGDAAGDVSVTGPEGPQKSDLTDAPGGGLAAQGLSAGKPGRYHVEARAHLAKDPRSTAFASVDFDVRPPRLVIEGPQIGGTLPLFAGETFQVTCTVHAEGTSATPRATAQLELPAGAADDDAAAPLTFAAGAPAKEPPAGVSVRFTGTGGTSTQRPGAYRLTIKATASTSAGMLTATTAALVPALLYVAPALEPASMQSDTPSTCALGVGSLMNEPVTVAVAGGKASPEAGGAGPAVAGPSMTMTRVETTSEYWPLEVDLTPPGDPALGPHALTLDLALSGRYKGGRTWQRHKSVGPLALEVTRPPVSGVVWFLLLLALLALALAKPSFAFCALVAADGRRHSLMSLGSLLADWGQAMQGVGGLDQPVAVTDESVEPVLLVGHWFGHYGILTASGERPLQSGQEVAVGKQTLRFIRFKDPGPPAPAAPPGDGPTDGTDSPHPHEEDLSKIA